MTPELERIVGTELLNADRDKKCVRAEERTPCPQYADSGGRERSSHDVSTWHC